MAVDAVRLPETWTIESFPFKRQPGVNPKQIRTLAELGSPEQLAAVVKGIVRRRCRIPLDTRGRVREQLEVAPGRNHVEAGQVTHA